MCVAMGIALYVWMIAFCLGSSLTSRSTMVVLSRTMMTDAEKDRQPAEENAENQRKRNQDRSLTIGAVSSSAQQHGSQNRTRHQENDEEDDDDDEEEVRYEDRVVFLGANNYGFEDKGGDEKDGEGKRREDERAMSDKEASGRDVGASSDSGGGKRSREEIDVGMGKGGGGGGGVAGAATKRKASLRLDRLRRQENPRDILDPSSSDVIAADDVRPTEAASTADDDLQTTSTAIDDDAPLSPLDFLDALQAAQPRDCPAASTTTTSSSRTTTLAHALPPSLHSVFAEQTASLVQTVNVLGNLFANPADSNLLSFSQNAVFYYALVRAVVESHEMVSAAAIAFERGEDGDEVKGQPYGPLAYRNRTNGRVSIGDLANVTHGVFTRGDSPDERPRRPWIDRSPSLSTSSSLHSSRSAVFPEKMLTACGASDGSTGAGAADHSDRRLTNASPAVAEAADGTWSRPYFDCAPGWRTWQLTYSLPVFGCSNSDIILKGVAKIELDLSKVDINQCPDSGDVFEKTHRCHASTSCDHVARHGFRRGGYRCTCRTGYYLPNSAAASAAAAGTPRHGGHAVVGSKSAYFNGTEIEKNQQLLVLSQGAAAGAAAGPAAEDFACLPCSEGCETCSGADPCPGSDDVIVSVIALVLQSVTMTAMLLAAVAVIRLRHTKVMKASFWLLLEIIIFGALLIYATVVIQYVTPSDVTCILIPWFREIGFIIIYGSLTLKVYRVLAEFQSRKAQRILLRDKDLLKYLAAMVTIVIGYMVTWTVINVDHIWKGASMVVHVENGTKYYYCNSTYWDYVIELEEFLFLLAAIYICYCIRSAPSLYLESKYISWAIYNETALSAIFNIVRHCLWSTVRPNYLYWMYFIRSQLTVTVTMLLVIGTKVWYIHRPPDDAICRRRTYSTTDAQDSNAPETTKLTPSIGYGIGGGGGGGAGGGEGDVGDINLSDMNPDDIRAELKRLYTQLQIYKTKSMRKDNPHISKRRGGRKPTHRRFSLQAFHYNKHKLQQGAEAASCEHENEASRSPEESTNSVDVVPVPVVSVGGGGGGGEGDAYGGGGGGGGGGEIRARSTSLSSRTASGGHR